MGPEAKIEKKAASYAHHQRDCINYKFVSPGRRGVPDRIFLPRGKPAFFIEFKAPGEGMSPSQRSEYYQITRKGHNVFVCDSLGEAKDIIDAYT